MAARGPFPSMTLMQATITFVVVFMGANVVIEPVRHLARHLVASLLAAPVWYFFIRWLRSRNA